jgi:transposase InsO family protein
MRTYVVDVGHRLGGNGWSWTATANFLHLAPRTLRHWRRSCAGVPGPAAALGRPTARSSREQRNEVIHLIDELGPGIGVPNLRACFPLMARAELAHLLQRYRRVWRRRHRQSLGCLHWTQPGRIWAIDFTDAPRPIDGLDGDLLAVRDLASGRQLFWLPVRAATADAVRAALTGLFAVHGAPLVLKCDNGSPFGAPAVRQLCAEFGVALLFSPPYMPRYNGAVEAGIGSLKARTEMAAARHGHPGFWTWDDVAAAQAEADTTARPLGPSGPNPAELWTARSPISAEERAAFQAAAQRHREAIAPADKPAATDLQATKEQRATDRQAIRRALEGLGYLLYSRRRIPLPIRRRKTASIT